MALRRIVSLLLCAHWAYANVEKLVFLGPQTVNVPAQHPTLDDLHIEVITPDDWILRTHLSAEFPQNETDKGKPSWVLFDGLTQGWQYEVRLCYAATVHCP